MAEKSSSIPHAQNADQNLELLAASSHAYAIGRRLSTAQTILALFAAGLGPILAWLNPTERVWGAFAGITILVLDAAILEPWHDRIRKLGTSIQELFDTRLFLLPWNKLKCGSVPDDEVLNGLTRAYQRSHPTLKHLRDWYPSNVAEIPMSYARLICQRANIRWDMSLRQTYAFVLLLTLVLLILGGLGYSLWTRMTAEQLVLSVLVPLLPLANRMGKECKAQYGVAAELENQKTHVEDFWEKSVSEPSMTEDMLLSESRRLQDLIYDRRLRTPRVPDALHRLRRDEYQAQMEEAASKYVDRVKMFLKRKGLSGVNTEKP